MGRGREAFESRMTNRKAQKRRLERAGFACLTNLWVPVVYAETVREYAGFYRAAVNAIKAGETPPEIILPITGTAPETSRARTARTAPPCRGSAHR